MNRRRPRVVLVPAGLLFLIGIRALMGPTFEQFMICYVFWVPCDRVVATLSLSPARGSQPGERRGDTAPARRRAALRFEG